MFLSPNLALRFVFLYTPPLPPASCLKLSLRGTPLAVLLSLSLSLCLPVHLSVHPSIWAPIPLWMPVFPPLSLSSFFLADSLHVCLFPCSHTFSNCLSLSLSPPLTYHPSSPSKDSNILILLMSFQDSQLFL